MIDYSALLYDPVYAAFGVPATMTVAGAGEVALTVVDHVRAKSNVTAASSSVEARSVEAAAFARIPELIANGIYREDYRGSILTFNGRTWAVRSHDLRGSPNGEDFGEVRFLLKPAEEGPLPPVTYNASLAEAALANFVLTGVVTSGGVVLTGDMAEAATADLVADATTDTNATSVEAAAATDLLNATRPGWVQSTNNTDLSDLSSTNACTITMKTGGVGTGNAVLFVVGWNDTTDNITSITDNASGFTNTYTLRPRLVSATEMSCCAYGLNIQGNPTQFTLHFGASKGAIIAYADEYGGYSGFGGASSAHSAVSSPASSGNITTVVPALIWGALWNNAATGGGVGPGFTVRCANKGGVILTEDLLQSAAGSVAATFTFPGSPDVVAHVIALYP